MLFLEIYIYIYVYLSPDYIDFFYIICIQTYESSLGPYLTIQ